MIKRFKNSGLVWPTIFTIVGLAVLVSLGNWQWDRMHWKEGLISAIQERTRAEPVALAGLSAVEPGEAGLEYLRVRLPGTFRHDLERHVYQLGREGPGWHIFTPLVVDGAEAAVWINRGYVPDALKRSAARPDSQPAGDIEIVGLYRLAQDPGFFVPDADPAANLWYAPDTAAMSAAVPGPLRVAPAYYFDAERSGDGWPRGGTTNLNLTNKHLGYALTWWGLALTLIGVYAAFAVQRFGREREPAASATRDTGAQT